MLPAASLTAAVPAAPHLRVRPVGGREATRTALAAVMGSTVFDFASDARSLRMLGQDRRHHELDPWLGHGLARLGVAPEAIPTYRRRGPRFDLCLEDSWSGWFLAPTLGSLAPDESLVLLHLDDHADLMPTLLVRQGPGTARDPAAGRAFDPRLPEDWEMAIGSGAVTIGSWLTALVAVGPPRAIHVRHLRPAGASMFPEFRTLRAGTVRHALLPGYAFVAAARDGAARGTCRAGSDPVETLAELPAGQIVVHVDLDYFVNDFNGNPGTAPTEPDRAAVLGRMDRFFAALRATRRPVRQWIVAASPGFCCARHWPWLLAALAARIGPA
jgi:hypothetical protein